MKVLAVIPARYAATRLPGKPLADIHGKPMIQWVYERAKASTALDRVIVATDDERIANAVRGFGGEVMMTAADIPSGTDRVAAVAEKFEADVYVNIQGDEPLMDPLAIAEVVRLVTSGRFKMATMMTPIRDASDLTNPAVVKVVSDSKDRSIYFSRHPIPYSRSPAPQSGEPFACRRHVGIYAYTRECLFRIRSLSASPLEKAEVLEQLRALEDGIAIGIKEINFLSIGVDTPDELEKVRAILKGA
ncbi:MAG: 3-deoxy-manno-octulosonate cytidylyltransferase [Cryobacterium sp.]|nr:3-deoxy-manno-octulosonate cytidylyltransferase [Oligoflexia bacterium]